MFSEQAAVELLDTLERAGVEPWVDGGWGVDALLCHETQLHAELGIPLPPEYRT